MHEKDTDADDGRSLVSNRTMEVVVALLLLGGCAIVITDTIRVGFGWQEGVGPAPGYFPFWIAVILGIASLMNLVTAVVRHGPGEIFVSMRPFGRVLAVLFPSLVFVALIGGIGLGPLHLPGIGIYLASLVFLSAFMVVIGQETFVRSIAVAFLVAVALFIMFEKLFLVPLPKCQGELCSGIEETLVGVPFDWLRANVMAILRTIRVVG